MCLEMSFCVFRFKDVMGLLSHMGLWGLLSHLSLVGILSLLSLLSLLCVSGVFSNKDAILLAENNFLDFNVL